MVIFRAVRGSWEAPFRSFTGTSVTFWSPEINFLNVLYCRWGLWAEGWVEALGGCFLEMLICCRRPSTLAEGGNHTPVVVKPHSLLCLWRQSREQEAPFLKYPTCAGCSGSGLLRTADLLWWDVHPPGKIWTVSHSRQQARAWLRVLGAAGSAVSQGPVTCALRMRGSAPPSLLPIFKAASFSNSHRQDHANQTKGREPCHRLSLWKRMLYLH